jgi:hypothetical protein
MDSTEPLHHTLTGWFVESPRVRLS